MQLSLLFNAPLRWLADPTRGAGAAEFRAEPPADRAWDFREFRAVTRVERQAGVRVCRVAFRAETAAGFPGYPAARRGGVEFRVHRAASKEAAAGEHWIALHSTR